MDFCPSRGPDAPLTQGQFSTESGKAKTRGAGLAWSVSSEQEWNGGGPRGRLRPAEVNQAALRWEDDDELLFFGGTFLPARRASDKPIAIACLRLFTFLPLRPILRRPRLNSCISRSTFLPALGLYLRRELDLRPRDDELLRREREVLRCELRAEALRRLRAELRRRELPLLRRLLLRDELLLREVERCLVAMS